MRAFLMIIRYFWIPACAGMTARLSSPRRRGSRFLILALFLFSSWAQAAEIACSDNYSYLVFDVENHQILSEKRADKILYPASLTKVMTLYLTLDAIRKGQLNIDSKLKFSAYGEEVSKVNKVNTLRVKEGDQMTVRQAIEAIITRSYNEAALLLAEAVAGDEWKFVSLMNQKARELGMLNTSFRNSSGLHEDGQYTTSYDLARLVIAIKKEFPKYYHFFAQKKFKYRGLEYENSNKFVMEYQGAEGMKTGFTKASGYNLISVARRGETRISSIVMSCADTQRRYLLTRYLLDEGFKISESKNLFTTKILLKFDYSIPRSENIQKRSNCCLSVATKPKAVTKSLAKKTPVTWKLVETH